MGMKATNNIRLRDLIDRIARLSVAGEWTDILNPAQRSVLSYLARANKFSRAPSNVADFMCTTRGTTSQTLKALVSKGLIALQRSSSDKRSISYDVTDAGRLLLNAPSDLDETLEALSAKDANALQSSLEATVREVLNRRGFRSFGVCQTCRYHLKSKQGRNCDLLKVPLTNIEATELCHEHDVVGN